MICYWSERCMLRPSLRFVSGQNTVCYDQVYDLLLVRTLCYDQVYDLLLFRTPYVTISNSYILIDCCVHIVFDQVYDLLLVRTLYVTTKLMICYWSERCMLCIFLSNYWWQKFDIWSQASYRYPISWEAFFDPSDSCILFAEERGYHRWALAHSSSCLLLVRTLYGMTKFMICYWSEHCTVWPSLWFVTGQYTVCYDHFSLWFVTGQNVVCYDQVYDLLLVRTL
jgi:hypothetical protein